VEEGETEEAGASLTPGGWSPFATETADRQKLFDEALKGFVGTGFKPFAVTSQVVAGAFSIFAANAKHVHPDSHEYPALIRVFKPLNGPARIRGIKAIGSPQGYLGGLSPFHETSGEEKAVLQKALDGFTGAGYEALVASVQVVAGLNLNFIGTQTLTTRDAHKYPCSSPFTSRLRANPSSLARKRCTTWCKPFWTLLPVFRDRFPAVWRGKSGRATIVAGQPLLPWPAFFCGAGFPWTGAVPARTS
jgi:hypothetical protein